ncbi:hypothetical protein BCF11_4242 [Collimonas sp. PA-H2]|nr:hypothetical protein BCF11_4242 [Collimonas sp. PA-H2]
MFFVNFPAEILMVGSLFTALPLHAEETLIADLLASAMERKSVT